MRSFSVAEQRCLYCGGDASAPDHWAHCDGRQGHVEDEARYPDGPGYQDTDTSYDARNRCARRPPRCARRFGCSSQEAHDGRNRAPLALEQVTVRARFAELHMQGVIVDSGERRENISGRKAIVWQRAG
jgi:hypothetical protein